MRYFGGLHGVGTLTSADATTNIRITYNFDGFLGKHRQVTGSGGEIRIPPMPPKRIFGRRELHLLTNDGRRLTLSFSEKQLPATGDAAQVDIGDDLSDESDRQH